MTSLASARGTLAVALVLVSTIAGAQTWKPPAESARCPSKWGASDERGAANHMTPAAVLNAARLIRTGEVIELGHVLSGSMPLRTGPKCCQVPLVKRIIRICSIGAWSDGLVLI